MSADRRLVVRDAVRRSGLLGRVAFGLAVLLSIVILFAPGSDVPSAPPGVDKVIHAGLFAVLAFTGRWAGIGVRTTAALLVGYAIASELIQGLSPLGRDGSVADALVDAGGLLVGLVIWAPLSRRHARR